MSVCIASLSEQGWILDDKKILNNLISYYFLTDGAQSIAFQGNLINLPYTYYLYINEPDNFKSAVKDDLDKLLSRYFEIVDVETSVKKLSESKYGILVFCSAITKNNVKVELSKVIEINTDGLRNVIDVNNYGDGLALLSAMT